MLFLRSRHLAATPTVLQRSLRRAHASDLDEHFKRGPGVRNDAKIGTEHPADLCRLDVDMNEFTALRVVSIAAGVSVGPSIADAEDEIRFQESRIAVTVAGLEADHSGHQVVIVGD